MLVAKVKSLRLKSMESIRLILCLASAFSVMSTDYGVGVYMS